MEENLIIPTITYVGIINNEIYANLVYPAGFGEDTEVKVTISDVPDILPSKVVDNFKNLNTDGTLSNTEKTLILSTSDTTLKYIVTISDPAREDVILELSYKKPNAQVSSNVSLKFIGSRILEVLFDEPMKQLSSVFDFNIDASNEHGLLYTYGHIDPNIDKNGLPIFLGIDSTTSQATAFAVYNNKKYLVKIDGTLDLTAEITVTINNIILAYSAYKSIDGADHKLIYVLKTGGFTVVKPTDTSIILASGESYYKKPITESPNETTVLTNFYFKYFGRDDEGTLYEPVGKPIDWLGYFANHDISFRISPDNRRVEVQFDDYDIPDGDHQLVLNYAKNFTGYTSEARIKDADNNIFPIVSKTVNVEKNAVRAKLIEIIALSRTKVLLKYDTPVMLIEDSQTVHSSFEIINPITINGVAVTTSRYANSYDQLICEIIDPKTYALPVGESVEITATGTLDRCGYLVDTETFTVPVSDIQPEVIEFTQIKPDNPKGDETATKFMVKFNDIMLEPIIASDNIRFFKIIGDEKIPVIDSTITATMQDPLIKNSITESDTMIITVENPPLNPGLYYKVEIDGMTNVIKTVMIPFSKIIYLNDLSVPYVKEILLAKENAKAIVKYNEMMNTTNDHSILLPENYQLITLEANNLNQCSTNCIKTALNFDNVSVIEGLKDNTWAKLIFIPETPIFSGDDNVNPGKYISHYIKPGYCDIKNVQYVTNISNNVLDFVCPAEHYLVNPFVVNDFSILFIDSQTIELTTKNDSAVKNQIFNAEATEFTITGSPVSEIIVAKSATISNTGRSVILEFEPDTITHANLMLNLTPLNTVDIFGNKLPSLSNIAITGYSTPTIASDFILLDTAGDSAKFLVRYSNDVMVEPGVPSNVASRDYSIEVTTGTNQIIPGRPAIDMQTLGNEVTLDFRNLNDYSLEETDSFRIGITSSQLKFNTIEATPDIFGNVDAARVFGFTPVKKGNLTRPYLGNDGIKNVFAIYVDDLGGTLEKPVSFSSIPLTFLNGIVQLDSTTNSIFESFKIELLDSVGLPYTLPILNAALVYNPAEIKNALSFEINLNVAVAITINAKITYKLKPNALKVDGVNLDTNRCGIVSSDNIKLLASIIP